MDFRTLLPRRPRPPAAFDSAKATEIVAFFVMRLGGTGDVLKLAKLVYLAERESYARYATALSGDRLASMKDGPVLSETLNFIRGEGKPPAVWQRYFSERVENSISLRSNNVTEESLLRLSDADVALLNDVWQKFGDMTTHQIWVYVHEQLPEYEDPGNSSRPIKMELLLTDVGYSGEQIKEILSRVNEQNEFHAALEKAAV